MTLLLEINSKTFRIESSENCVSRSILPKLPCRVIFETFGHNQLIAFSSIRPNLPKVQFLREAHAGDIAYYLPWGSFAVFLNTSAVSGYYAKLGRLNEESLLALKANTNTPVVLRAN